MERSRSPNSRRHHDAHEDRLKAEHQQLFHHWSDVVGLDVNPTISENTYKHHVARLFHVYTHHKTTIDNKHPVKDGRKKPAISRLYGVNGISTKKKKKNVKRKEDGWENRIILTSNLDDLNRKSKAKAELLETSMATSGMQRLDMGSGIGSPQRRPQTAPSHSQSKKGVLSASMESFEKPKRQHRSHRVDFEGVSDNDLIANGLYYLDDEQMEVYDRFTSLLASHDPFDMIKILEDALHDAKKKTSMDSYGGTELPQGSEAT